MYDYFDRQSEGLINLEEFLRVLRGRMPEHREALVDRTYEDLARKTQGLPLTIEDIRLKFNAENHPDVDSGRRQADIVTNEFLEEFEIHHLLWVIQFLICRLKIHQGKQKPSRERSSLSFTIQLVLFHQMTCTLNKSLQKSGFNRGEIRFTGQDTNCNSIECY